MMKLSYLSLKRRLSDTSYVNKQNISPVLVNKALEKLTEINPFYRSVCIDDSWATVSQETDPLLWSASTNKMHVLMKILKLIRMRKLREIMLLIKKGSINHLCHFYLCCKILMALNYLLMML